MTIKAGIVGYGNLGQGVEYLINSLEDFELFGIFSRRESLDTDAAVYPVADAAKYQDDIDVMFLCVGSATDIPEQATILHSTSPLLIPMTTTQGSRTS